MPHSSARYLLLRTFLPAILLLAGCGPDDTYPEKRAEFESVPVKTPVPEGQIDEASGIADSRNLLQHVWIHQDEDLGDPASLFLLDRNTGALTRHLVPKTINRDWEDMAGGPGPEKGVYYLYIGDIGNNFKLRDTAYVYRVKEITNKNQDFPESSVETILFRFPDGIHDAETLLLDPLSLDLFIITKEMSRARLYRLPYPQSTSAIITAEYVGVLPSVSLVTSGDISPDGDEILIRTYTGVYYWRRDRNNLVGQTLTGQPTGTVSTEIEQQGEAICFDQGAKGFFTLSERQPGGPPVTLNYYRRK